MLSRKEKVILKIQGFSFFQLKYNLIAFCKVWLFFVNLAVQKFWVLKRSTLCSLPKWECSIIMCKMKESSSTGILSAFPPERLVWIWKTSQATFIHHSLLNHYKPWSSVPPHHKCHCCNWHELSPPGSLRKATFTEPALSCHRQAEVLSI